MTHGTQSAAEDITAAVFELAEAARVVINTRPGVTVLPAIRLLRDEYGGTLRKAKMVLDRIRAPLSVASIGRTLDAQAILRRCS